MGCFQNALIDVPPLTNPASCCIICPYIMKRQRHRFCKGCWSVCNQKRRYCRYCSVVRQRFKVDPKSIYQLQVAQEWKCKICGGTGTDRRLAVDHDHLTGVIRGLLCTRCNMGLGFFRTPENLRKAIDYLESSPPVVRYMHGPKGYSNKPVDHTPRDREAARKILADDTYPSLREKAKVYAELGGISEECARGRLRRLQKSLMKEATI